MAKLPDVEIGLGADMRALMDVLRSVRIFSDLVMARAAETKDADLMAIIAEFNDRLAGELTRLAVEARAVRKDEHKGFFKRFFKKRSKK